MPEPAPSEQRLWEAGWARHSLAQRRRLARLSLIQKLDWLEEAQRLLEHLARRSPRRDAGGSSS